MIQKVSTKELKDFGVTLDICDADNPYSEIRYKEHHVCVVKNGDDQDCWEIEFDSGTEASGTVIPLDVFYEIVLHAKKQLLGQIKKGYSKSLGIPIAKDFEITSDGCDNNISCAKVLYKENHLCTVMQNDGVWQILFIFIAGHDDEKRIMPIDEFYEALLHAKMRIWIFRKKEKKYSECFKKAWWKLAEDLKKTGVLIKTDLEKAGKVIKTWLHRIFRNIFN